MAKYPKVPVYLFYGTNTAQIIKARDEVVGMLLKGANEESVISFESERKGNEKVIHLQRALGRLSSDLATMSFIEEPTKIGIIQDPAEVYAGGYSAKRSSKPSAKKVKTAPEGGEDQGLRDVMNWFEKLLPVTGNHVILLASEDESTDREVNEQSPIVQLVMRIGFHQRFRDGSKLVFQLEDALRSRELRDTLSIIRELWNPDGGDGKVFNAVTRSLRFMLQAQIARDRRTVEDPGMKAVCFPASNYSILNQHEVVQKKYLRGTIPYRVVDLAKAYEELTGVYRAMRPAPGQVHVADARSLLERILVELFASPHPR